MNCCRRKKNKHEVRQVLVGRDKNHHYKHNEIKTTKYTAWNFLPKALAIQFMRPANVIFLVTAILQSITIISALSPFTAVAPFIVVISVSLAREAFEDYKRYKNDKATNAQKTLHLVDGQFVECRWKDLKVGDIVKVLNDEQIPADMILLYSSEENGLCYVETANLDGQRNLKTRNIASDKIRLYPNQFQSLNCIFTVDPPSPSIHEFSGLMTQNNVSRVISEENLLLRATMVKNTDEIVGVVVYAGMDTKILLNLNKVRHKVSRVERKVHVIQLVLFCVLFLLCLTASLLYYRDFKPWHSRDNIFYLRNKHHWTIKKDAALLGLTNFLLLNFLIPISMNIVMEILKAFQGDLLAFDIEMSYVRDHKRQYCKVLNTSILEQLGNVEYILTDKTGTLTSNTMEFKYVYINGQDYSAESLMANKQRNVQNQEFVKFWTGVVLCHDVVVDYRKNQYQGSSADEICFLDQAKLIGFVFKKRTRVSIEVEILNQRKVYDLLLMFPFTDRKMMSVIVRDIETNSILMLIKGADSSVLPRKSPQQRADIVRNIEQSLTRFSKQGLRTLVFGKRTLSQQQFQQLKQQYDALQMAKSSGAFSKQNKDAYRQEYNNLVLKYETNITLTGVSAIQDKLQDGVPETIKRLQEAEIKVVMITGDKLETAENIGYLSNFITDQAKIYRLKENMPNWPYQITTIMADISMNQIYHFSVLVEGSMIANILNCEDPTIINAFKFIVDHCSSLIFCRSTPKQKGQIVKFFKKQFKKTVLCVGDGGNDVNMIQQADVGVGILGKEGNQAAAASDFFFCQFRFLDRLILHHGRWTYTRISYFFVFYGFKNMIITVILFSFLGYCGWSGANFLSTVYLAVYNSVINVAYTIYAGVYDQDVNADMYPPLYAEQPTLYRQAKRMGLFSYTRYIVWSICSIGAGCWIFFTTIYGISSINAADDVGRVADQRTLSSDVAVSTHLCVIFLLYLDTYNFTIWTWAIVLIFTLLISFLYFIFENFANFGQNYRAYGDNFRLKFWFLILVNGWSCYGLRTAYNTLRFHVFPSLSQQWMMKRNHDYRVVKHARKNMKPEDLYRMTHTPPALMGQNKYDMGTLSTSARTASTLTKQNPMSPSYSMQPTTSHTIPHSLPSAQMLVPRTPQKNSALQVSFQSPNSPTPINAPPRSPTHQIVQIPPGGTYPPRAYPQPVPVYQVPQAVYEKPYQPVSAIQTYGYGNGNTSYGNYGNGNNGNGGFSNGNGYTNTNISGYGNGYSVEHGYPRNNGGEISGYGNGQSSVDYHQQQHFGTPRTNGPSYVQQRLDHRSYSPLNQRNGHQPPPSARRYTPNMPPSFPRFM